MSRSSAEQIHSIFGVPAEKVTMVGVGIDLPNMSQRQKEEDEEIKDIDFLCIGRLEKFEGIEEIWEAVRKAGPGASFEMAGRPGSREGIERLESTGVSHLGFVSDAKEAGLYSRARVFIFPLTMEGFGMAVAEAI